MGDWDFDNFENDCERDEPAYTQPEVAEYDDGTEIRCYGNGCIFTRGTGTDPENCYDCGSTRQMLNIWKCGCERICYSCYQQRKQNIQEQETERVRQETNAKAIKEREIKLMTEMKTSTRPQLNWGHGFDNPQGSTREWPINYFHIKPVDVGKRGLMVSVGMRFNANPSSGFKMKIAIFTCPQPNDLSSCYLGSMVGRVKGILEFRGTEIGVNEFPLETPVTLSVGRYFIVTFMGGSCCLFDHLEGPDYQGCSFYATDAIGIDKILEPDHPLPQAWTIYNARMSWWLTTKNEVNAKKTFTPFIEALEHHLTTSQQEGSVKTYFPPFPDGWHEDIQIKKGVLSVASELGSVKVMEYLCEHEKDVLDSLYNGASPLMVSAMCGQTSIVSLLLQQEKVNVLQRSENDCSLGAERDALLFACSGIKPNMDNAGVVNVLLEHKASVYSVDENKRTCLHLSASNLGSEAVVSLLLKGGANIEQIDEFGQTALLCACSKNNVAVVNLLLEAKADLHVTDKAGRTGLHLACYYGAAAVAECLLEAKATQQVDRKDQEGLTPLAVAAARSFSDISALLKNAYASLGYSVCWGLTAGDGARHHIEPNKLSCIRIVVPVESRASHIGICFFDSAEWDGDGTVSVGLYGDTGGFPDVSTLLAGGQDKIQASQCKGQEILFPLDREVPMARGASYWAAFASDIMTVVSKDARVKEKNRTYLQCASLESCWADAKSARWKQHQCSLALFIRTKSTNQQDAHTAPAASPIAIATATPSESPVVSLHVAS